MDNIVAKFTKCVMHIVSKNASTMCSKPNGPILFSAMSRKTML